MNTETGLVEQITSTLRGADHAIELSQWAAANVLLKRGLAEMGDRYARATTIDDSGMKLVLADMEDQKGNPQAASAIRRRVLAERLSQLREKSAGAAR